MNKKISFTLLVFFASEMAFAHFQMMYTPSSIIEGDTKEVPFKVIFTHPFEAGLTMDIGKNEAGEVKGMEHFFVVHKKKSIDAVSKLKEMTFTSLENSAKGFDFILNKDSSFRGGGDWVLVAVPYPYYEGSEDSYIQQITKVIINKGTLDTDWSDRVAEGYPEILPLVKPYDVWVGGIFRAMIVDGKGKPVQHAEIEVVYCNYDVDMHNNKFTGSPRITKGSTVIHADAQGNFSFVPTAPGYWGFAASEAGGKKQFNGKELSEDAVLWIEAFAAE
ncbi:MAG: DUF4198 domain-containing protein [Treponema sp.]